MVVPSVSSCLRLVKKGLGDGFMRYVFLVSSISDHMVAHGYFLFFPATIDDPIRDQDIPHRLNPSILNQSRLWTHRSISLRIVILSYRAGSECI